MREVTIPITFQIGTLEEIGLGGFKQPWIDADANGHPGRKFDLTCGAGLGNSWVEAAGHDGDQAVYARASITPVATAIFNELAKEFRDA